MKLANIIISISIIIFGILECNSGNNPSWWGYFVGWAFVLYYDIQELFND